MLDKIVAGRQKSSISWVDETLVIKVKWKKKCIKQFNFVLIRRSRRCTQINRDWNIVTTGTWTKVFINFIIIALSKISHHRVFIRQLSFIITLKKCCFFSDSTKCLLIPKLPLDLHLLLSDRRQLSWCFRLGVNHGGRERDRNFDLRNKHIQWV